uniref:Nuclear Testis protein N-terminal domain-containing protein n=1 Tax=Sus scrofa TaxID=9823 RepID=A0A4X1SQG2_PIG
MELHIYYYKPWCCDSENQHIHCLTRHSTIVWPLHKVEETSGSCLPAEASMEWHPTPTQAHLPRPLPHCRMTGGPHSTGSFSSRSDHEHPCQDICTTHRFLGQMPLPTEVCPLSPQRASVHVAHSPLPFTPFLSLHSIPLLGTDVVMPPGASRSYPPPTPGSQPQPAWEQHLPPPMAPLLLPGSTLLQPPHPMTPRVTPADHGPIAPGLGNIPVPVWSGGRSALPHQSQAFGCPQAPLNGNASRALMGSALCPAPLCIAGPAGDSGVAAPAIAAAQAGKGGLAPGLPPQAAPPAAQMAFILPPGSSGPWPHGTSGAGSLHASQHTGPQEDASHHKSVYQNFRRWQRFKSLARSHLPQIPLRPSLAHPVLRTLARLKPTMTLEEGMRQAMQEWQHMSTVERMAFYEMAAKSGHMSRGPHCPPCVPKPGPRDLTWSLLGHALQLQAGQAGEPRSWPVPEQLPADTCAPRNHGPRVQHTTPRPRRAWQLLENKAPKEIPPEARREHGDIPQALVGPGPSATGESDMECREDGYELPQDEDGCFPDPDLLSYVDKLCSQEDFDTKVEAVIHPRFLAELLSPEPELDLSGLAEELEQEEGLSPEEVARGGTDTRETWGRGLDSRPSESVARQDAQRNEQGPQPGVRDETCTPQMDFHGHLRHPQTDRGPFRHKGSVPSPGLQEPLRLELHSHFLARQQALGPPSGPRASKVLREASPLSGAPGLGHRFSEDEEELPSLAFLLGLHYSLLPWGCHRALSLPRSCLHCRAEGPASFQAPVPQRMGLSSGPLEAAKSRKRARCGGLAAAEDLARPRADLRGSGRHTLALGLGDPSQPKGTGPPKTERGSERNEACVRSPGSLDPQVKD